MNDYVRCPVCKGKGKCGIKVQGVLLSCQWCLGKRVVTVWFAEYVKKQLNIKDEEAEQTELNLEA